jgi:hypothetical protein
VARLATIELEVELSEGTLAAALHEEHALLELRVAHLLRATAPPRRPFSSRRRSSSGEMVPPGFLTFSGSCAERVSEPGRPPMAAVPRQVPNPLRNERGCMPLPRNGASRSGHSRRFR